MLLFRLDFNVKLPTAFKLDKVKDFIVYDLRLLLVYQCMCVFILSSTLTLLNFFQGRRNDDHHVKVVMLLCLMCF